MGGRAKFSKHALINGGYYKTNEIITLGTFELKKFYQNNSATGGGSAVPTSIPSFNFDLNDLTRANKIKDEFEWFRFKRCVLRVKPCQDERSVMWLNGNTVPNPPTTPTVTGVIEPPNFVTFFDGDGANTAPKSYNNAVIRPYSKLHPLNSKYGFARAFKPMIQKTITVGQDGATDLEVPHKLSMKWLPLKQEADSVEIYGPQLYIPAWNYIAGTPSSLTSFPKFTCTVSCVVEFKGKRVSAV